MNASTMRPLQIAAAATAVAFGLAFLASPVTLEVLRTTAPRGTADVARFGGTQALGQAFLAPEDRLAEIRFSLQTPIPKEAFPIIVHLRHGRYAKRDVRTVVITAKDVNVHGETRVRFIPIERSAGRPYAFVLEAPKAQRESLAVYWQVDGSIYENGHLFLSQTNEDRPGDLEFSAHVRQSRLAAFRNLHIRQPVQAIRAGPELPRALGFGVLATALLFVLLRFLRRSPRPEYVPRILVLLVVTHILLHAPFLFPYPGVNDEGSYLMDIQNIRAGHWPFRDTLAKGPLFLLLLSPVALFLPHTLLPGRLLVAAASGLEVVLLYVLGRRLGGTTAGLLAAILWALSPVAVAQTSQLFLQPFSLPLVTLAVIVLLGTPPEDREPLLGKHSAWRLRGVRLKPFLGGVLFALAYLVRASSLAFLPPALFAHALLRPSARDGARATLRVLGGFGLTLGMVAALVYPLLGAERTAVFFNVEAYTIGRARSGGGDAASPLTFLPPPEIYERFVAHGAALFRTGLPLVLLWLAFVSAHLARLLRLPAALGGAIFFGTMLPLLQEVYKANFFLSGDSAASGPALKLLTTLLTALIGILLWWPAGTRVQEERAERRPRRILLELVLVGGTWLFLILLYASFGRFRQQYHAEFLPAYVLGSALFLSRTLPAAVSDQQPNAGWRPRLKSVVATLLMVVMIATFPLAYRASRARHHAGSIPHRTAIEVSRILQAHSSPGEEILTAQSLFTFYADRHLPFGASHPGWYLEERVGTVPPELRRLFLPDKAELRRYVQEKPIRLVAIDRRTREVYFSYDPEMQTILARDFRLLATVKNDFEEKPVEIWIRK